MGFDIVPNAIVNFGLNYGQEKYDTLQASRTSNPAPDPTFTDPRRDWTNTINDKVNTFSTNLSLTRPSPGRTSALATTSAMATRTTSTGWSRTRR